MDNSIDCLFIGHNEMNFQAYEKLIRQMGKKTCAYRDLNLSFIQIDNKPYSITDTFNAFYADHPALDNSLGPFGTGNTLSLAIAYLGTFIHKRGFTFDYVNSFQYEKDLLAQKLREKNVLTIAILTTLYVSMFPILEIVSFIRKHNKTAKIIVGGPFIATQVRTQDKKAIDFVLSSIDADFYVDSTQGEATLVQILKALKNNLSVEDIANVYFKNHNGYSFTSTVKEDNKLQDNLVDWTMFSDRMNKLAAVRTSMSCPFACSFCGFPQHAGKYQTNPVEAVEQELNLLTSKGNVECVNFIDDTFNVPASRFKEILKMMIKNKYRFRWNSFFRCQYADEETIELMKKSGCEGAYLGIESGSPQILVNMNKSATVEAYARGITLLKQYGITTHASFIIGFPGETQETAQETIQFLKEYQPDFFRVQNWYCEQITPIWKEREKYSLKGSQFEWSHKTMNSQTSADLVDKMVMSLDGSVWVPMYNFDFLSVFNLKHRNMTLSQVKRFLKAFQTGIREKLEHPDNADISPATMHKLKTVLEAE